MPDFSAISAALTAVKNILDGVVGLTGSITGDAASDAFSTLSSGFGGGTEAA